MPVRIMGFARKGSRKRARSVSRSRSSRSSSRVGFRSRSRSRVRAQGVHTFSRHCAAQTVDINGTFLSRQYNDKFEDMIQSSDFTSLFDMYRIVKVTYTFQLINVPEASLVPNASSASFANGTNWYPKMWYIVDHDGGTTETLNSMRERQGTKCRILQPNKVVKVSWTPKCRVLTYSTDTTQGYAPRNIKVDMNDTAIPHYGLAVVFDTNGYDPSDSYPFKIAVERKITFKCFGVR